MPYSVGVKTLKRLLGWLTVSGAIRASIGLAVMLLALFLSMTPVQAQATRTWVSGVGDDANPCSRTAPCKTFAGAISKTATAGIINCLDPGGFGGVTIIKSITIDCKSTFGGILVSGTNAVIINGPSIVVHLRGLSIEGLNTGLIGVNIIQAASVTIEDSHIFGFNGGAARGVFAPANTAVSSFMQLFITNTTIEENGVTAAGGNISGGGGVVIGNPAPGAANAGVVRASINNSDILRNGVGLRLSPNSDTTINNSSVMGNVGFGVLAASGGAVAFVNIVDSNISESIAGTGVRAEGVNATVRMNRTSVHGNSVGIEAFSGGALLSSGNNVVQGNFTTNGVFTGASPLS
jgi:hypothetical protein